MIQTVIILVIMVLALIGANVLFIKKYKKEKKRAEGLEIEVKKIKGNIVRISQSYARDKKIIKGGDTIGKAIKKSKTDNDAFEILFNVSADLDGLL